MMAYLYPLLGFFSMRPRAPLRALSLAYFREELKLRVVTIELVQNSELVGA
jgi:hypothetical protein